MVSVVGRMGMQLILALDYAGRIGPFFHLHCFV